MLSFIHPKVIQTSVVKLQQKMSNKKNYVKLDKLNVNIIFLNSYNWNCIYLF